MDGILPINKPAGMTSYDVIRRVKRVLPRGTKIGHAGTLDPFAEGVLLILLGKATKKFDEIQGWKKTYLATAKLGAKSETLDREGKIEEVSVTRNKLLTKENVEKAAKKYVGEIEQAIPKYAAAKYRGRKFYEYAREGKEVPQKSKKVNVYSIEVVKVSDQKVELLVVCGSGTYVRQLSYDILKNLGVESYLEKLVRESVGEINLRDCLTLERVIDINMADKLLPLNGGG